MNKFFTIIFIATAAISSFARADDKITIVKPKNVSTKQDDKKNKILSLVRKKEPAKAKLSEVKKISVTPKASVKEKLPTEKQTALKPVNTTVKPLKVKQDQQAMASKAGQECLQREEARNAKSKEASNSIIGKFFSSKSDKKNENNKTEGDYLGLGLVGVKASFNDRNVDVFSKRPVNSYPSYSNEGLGVGVSYKHAFNFNKVFIAPGIFFDQLETTVNGADGPYYNFPNSKRSLMRLDLKNRYGIKTDFGYDLNNYLSPYLTVGYNVVNYRTQNFYYDFSAPAVSTIRNGSVKDFVYGAGLKINYNSDLALNIEYNTQSFLAKTYLPANPYQVTSLYKVNLQTLSLGITHKF